MLHIWTALLALALLFGHGEGESCRPGAQDVVRNVAKGCSAYQSSTYQHPKNLIAEKAVDGDCSGNLPRDGSCSHTNADLDPWWYVDLGENYTVSAVLVKNRQDCCPERLDKAQVRVGYSVAANSKFNPLCGTVKDSSAGSTSTIQCNHLIGRIVSINIPNEKEYLTLCEVEVYAMKVAEVCP
ncbi:fucolectin-like [Anolis sagrei]|uniref:fucolectin-like n=1 Tax=Anolis sagrei TaxID=38937 RepID=UPI0035205921